MPNLIKKSVTVTNSGVPANSQIRSVLNDFFCYSRDKIEYWNELCPCTGRPNSAAMCKQKNPQAVQKSVVS